MDTDRTTGRGTGQVTVVIADEHPLYLEGIRSALHDCTDITVTGAASEPIDAMRLAARLRPRVALIDVAMPEVVDYLTRRCPAVRVLTLGTGDDGRNLLTALRAGTYGHLLKGSEPGEVAAALRSVALGQMVFGRGVGTRLLAHLSAPVMRMPFPGLTQREREVLEYLADGRSNAEIARELCLAPKTVRNHVSNVLNKLEAPTRVDAALRARDAGLGSRLVLTHV
ncbi:response regulator transcription factor [Microtetraspora sp. AC03309]|uniref:LuxR C-terminal-related transcriptional regulator n=1 Tax=Microtetraspora sp. AC03309 TaxID=2779376 RepID=UPI001E58326D|nr:response regulator transcription factor [Microtetraspora sp. AC03309]MCC5577907.1 response regulator transcription factor [Microtetraspora sp. AC03309]